MKKVFNLLHELSNYSVEELNMLKYFLRGNGSAYIVKTLTQLIDIFIEENRIKDENDKVYEGKQTQFDNLL